MPFQKTTNAVAPTMAPPRRSHRAGSRLLKAAEAVTAPNVLFEFGRRTGGEHSCYAIGRPLTKIRLSVLGETGDVPRTASV